MIELFWPALILTAALVVLLMPFGRLVIQRRVIFLDLAVGQWAALGAATGALWFHELVGLWTGAVVGALLAASFVRWLASGQQAHTVLEAPIGLMYALALAVFMLLQSNAGSQREVLAALVAYDVLFASAEQAYGSLLVAAASAVLWRYWSWWSTQGFYWAFALVCAFSVKMAGLLVVFVLLLAPALLFGAVQKMEWRQLAGTIGLVWLALFLSLWMDWPAGYTLVAFLSGITLLTMSFRR